MVMVAVGISNKFTFVVKLINSIRRCIKRKSSQYSLDWELKTFDCHKVLYGMFKSN